MTICLNVTHAAHLPERQATMLRLRESLPSNILIPYNEVTHRGPHWEWAELGWRWANAQHKCTHALFLQDDVLPMPELIDVVNAMTKAVPDTVIALHSPHPGASVHCFQSGHPFYTSADNLVGTAYVLPRWVLEDFLGWRDSEIVNKTAITEDTLLTLYCMSTGRPIYHPVPSPIDHDVSVESTNATRDDGGAFLRPMIPWWKLLEANPDWDRARMTEVSFWKPTRPVPHVGKTRRANHWMLVTQLKRPLPLRAYQVEQDVTWQMPRV